MRQDQLAWHRVHNEAFRRFAGIPAVVRIDKNAVFVEVEGAQPARYQFHKGVSSP